MHTVDMSVLILHPDQDNREYLGPYTGISNLLSCTSVPLFYSFIVLLSSRLSPIFRHIVTNIFDDKTNNRDKRMIRALIRACTINVDIEALYCCLLGLTIRLDHTKSYYIQ